LTGKYERKRSSGKPRRRWKDNVTIDIKEVGRESMLGWMFMYQDKDQWRFVLNMVMNFRILYDAGNLY
jgi:hypothetical protein